MNGFMYSWNDVGHLELGEPVQPVVTIDMERLDRYFAHELQIKTQSITAIFIFLKQFG
jgi:hypothetical protein